MGNNKRHHTAIAAASSASSDEDEEDAFAKISTSMPSSSHNPPLNFINSSSSRSVSTKSKLKSLEFSASVSSSRKEKMDALLHDIQTSKDESHIYNNSNSNSNNNNNNNYRDNNVNHFLGSGGGSFCADAEEEQLTTNIYVGNLPPIVTEEELSELFLPFGNLYSVKIMWPRTDEERARRRNTGFVCFMHRKDAEEAIDSLNEYELAGHRITLGWGKNVKKLVQRGNTSASFLKPSSLDPSTSKCNAKNVEERKFQPVRDLPHAMHIIVPKNSERVSFITTLASFVAKDGSTLENLVLQREFNNPKFDFLHPHPPALSNIDSIRHQEERNFYKWRIYSFVQGDGKYFWRTEPFQMFVNGKWWIPPPIIDKEAALREKLHRGRDQTKSRLDNAGTREKEKNEINSTPTGDLERCREQANRKDRQPTNQNQRRSAHVVKLKSYQRDDFRKMLRNLVASRESICLCMAFCFERSGSALELCDMIRTHFTSDPASTKAHLSTDSKIAGLYLLSDILFNSQQPGVRHAFRYRDAIEKMAPEIFENAGKGGRMSLNKVRKAVHRVLNAWSHWSVYTHEFITDLESKFEGKEVIRHDVTAEITKEDDENVDGVPLSGDEYGDEIVIDNHAETFDKNRAQQKARGGWKDVTEIKEEKDDRIVDISDLIDPELDGEPLQEGELENLVLFSCRSSMPNQ